MTDRKEAQREVEQMSNEIRAATAGRLRKAIRRHSRNAVIRHQGVTVADVMGLLDQLVPMTKRYVAKLGADRINWIWGD